MTAKSDGSLNHVDIQRGFDCVAANAIKKAAEEYVSYIKSGKSKDVAMESCSQSRFVAAKLHTMGSMFRMYREAVEEMPVTDESKVLKTVCTLYGLWQMEELQGAFLKCKCFGQ
jgi:acyl-CoA oxidase